MGGSQYAARGFDLGSAGGLTSASVLSLARSIARREVSALDVLDAHLERISQVDPHINAVVAIANHARDRAREADRQLERDEATGPPHGVPFTVKDNIETAGIATTAGAVERVGRSPPRSSRGTGANDVALALAAALEERRPAGEVTGNRDPG